jgi:hypothetical protein
MTAIAGVGYCAIAVCWVDYEPPSRVKAFKLARGSEEVSRASQFPGRAVPGAWDQADFACMHRTQRRFSYLSLCDLAEQAEYAVNATACRSLHWRPSSWFGRSIIDGSFCLNPSLSLRVGPALHFEHKHPVVGAAARRPRQSALFEPVLHEPSKPHAAPASQLRVGVVPWPPGPRFHRAAALGSVRPHRPR